MDENTNTSNETLEEKKTEQRTFTQAEKDKEIAMVIKREREKFQDYDSIKGDYEKLVNAEKERELQTKTETEKLSIQLQEVQEKLVQANGQIASFTQEKTRMTVLDDEKYRSLPRAYKNMVAMSDDIETVQESAEKALEEFNKDFSGKVSNTFGIPNKSNKEPSEVDKKITEVSKPSDIASTLRAKLNNAIRNRQ